MDLCPSAGLNALLNMANIHLLPQLAGASDLVMPSKLTGMLASDRPVIATKSRGSKTVTVLDLGSSMNAVLSEGAWIDRFALELARLGAPVEPQLLIDMGREVWPFLGELNPEDVARANWGDAAVSPA